MQTTARKIIPIFIYNFLRKLAQNAIHSAFSGFTNFTSGMINNQPVLIPVNYIASLGTRKINTKSDVEYLSMLASTGQSSFQHPLKTICSNLSSPIDLINQTGTKTHFSGFDNQIKSTIQLIDHSKLPEN